MARLKAPQRREQLIEVATKLFARAGYDATTTSAIAEAAGVTEPILYRHFKTKQDLFVAIVRRVSENTLASWKAAAEKVDDPAERIRSIAVSIPDHVRKFGDSYHVLHGALSTSRDKKVLAVTREHYEAMEAFFAKMISDGQKAGIFRRDLKPESAAWQFIFAGIGFAMISLNLPTVAKNTSDEVIEGLLSGLKAQ